MKNPLRDEPMYLEIGSKKTIFTLRKKNNIYQMIDKTMIEEIKIVKMC